MQTKAKHQLETVLIIHDVQGKKFVNVIYRNLVSWVATAQEFDQSKIVVLLILC